MIIIVGAGLAGLTCAKELIEAGQQVLMLEGSDGIGGEYAPMVLRRGIALIVGSRSCLAPILL